MAIPLENFSNPNSAQSVNPNSQIQINLTTQPSGDNSSNDYSGYQFFSGCGGGRNNHGGRGSGCDGRGSRRSGRGGRGRFADVQCQICYKFGQGASFCYHRLEENYVPLFLHLLLHKLLQHNLFNGLLLLSPHSKFSMPNLFST